MSRILEMTISFFSHCSRAAILQRRLWINGYDDFPYRWCSNTSNSLPPRLPGFQTRTAIFSTGSETLAVYATATRIDSSGWGTAVEFGEGIEMELGATGTMKRANRLRPAPQPVAAQLTRAAIFLVVKLKPGPIHRATIRSFCGDLAALLRAVGARDTA